MYGAPYAPGVWLCARGSEAEPRRQGKRTSCMQREAEPCRWGSRHRACNTRRNRADGVADKACVALDLRARVSQNQPAALWRPRMALGLSAHLRHYPRGFPARKCAYPGGVIVFILPGKYTNKRLPRLGNGRRGPGGPLWVSATRPSAGMPAGVRRERVCSHIS